MDTGRFGRWGKHDAAAAVQLQIDREPERLIGLSDGLERNADTRRDRGNGTCPGHCLGAVIIPADIRDALNAGHVRDTDREGRILPVDILNIPTQQVEIGK